MQVGSESSWPVSVVLPGGDKGTFSELLLQLFMVIGNRPAGTARIHRKISNFLLFLFAILPSNVLKLITNIAILRTVAV